MPWLHLVAYFFGGAFLDVPMARHRLGNAPSD